MFAAAVSLLGAFVFGAADFLGGIAAKKLTALLATAVSAFVGLLVMIAIHPFVNSEWTNTDVLWGVVSGICGAIAISLLYAALAIGPMSILSPLTAVISALVPTMWGALNGETLTPLGYVAIALALLAVVLVGFVPEQGVVRPHVQGVLFAVGSGVAIGTFFVIIDQSSPDSGVVPLLASRATNVTLVLATLALIVLLRAIRGHGVVGVFVRESTPDSQSRNTLSTRKVLRVGIVLASAGGILDAFANLLILIGIRAGELTVASVLAALYPAGTIVLAAVVLRERIAPVQWAGLALALTAAGMLAVV